VCSLFAGRQLFRQSLAFSLASEFFRRLAGNFLAGRQLYCRLAAFPPVDSLFASRPNFGRLAAFLQVDSLAFSQVSSGCQLSANRQVLIYRRLFTIAS
jgi:hypothetical protein